MKMTNEGREEVLDVFWLVFCTLSKIDAFDSLYPILFVKKKKES